MGKSNRSYKELTLQQLRSLCETARQGSFLGAAAALDLSQPTVWKQVHALEREFGTKLVEPHGRGCAMTAAGRLLVEMVRPGVESIAAVRERFRAALADEGEHLAVATTPRMLLDEIVPCVTRFHAELPKTQFTFVELFDDRVAEAVLDRRADVGFTPTPLMGEEQLRSLTAEPAYALEVRLIARPDHPLARLRSVRPRDLARYPIINRPPVDSSAYARLVRELHGDRRPPWALVQTGFTSSIRRFVKLGYGIGLIPTAPSVPPDPELHERPLRRLFGRIPVHLIRRRGGYLPGAAESFVRLVCRELGGETSGR